MSLAPFNLCIADPAWSYDQKGTNGAADNHYKTMGMDELMALGPLVSDVMAKDAIIMVWGTWPLLKETIQFVEACGFEYKTCGGLWAKTNKKSPGWFMGPGFYVRGNSEFVLLGKRGKPVRVDRGVRQIMTDPVSAHSRKPDVLHRRAEQLMGDVPRLEIFARRPMPGWHCLGNELDQRDLRESLPDLARQMSDGDPTGAITA